MRRCRAKRWAAAVASAGALLSIAIVAGVALVLVNGARVREGAARKEAETLAYRNQTVVDSFVAAFRSVDPQQEGVTGKMTALEVIEQALAQIEADDELAADELTKATLLQALGHSLYSLGAYDQSTNAYEETFRLRNAKLGPEHLSTLTSMGNLALGFKAAGRLEEALPLYEETLRLTKAKLGPKHPDTLTSMNNLAAGYRAAGRLEEALPLYEETLRLTIAANQVVRRSKRSRKRMDRHYGAMPAPDMAQLAHAKTSLAESLVGLKRYEEAGTQIDAALVIDEIDDLQRLRAKSIQGAILATQSKWQASEPLLIESAKTLADQLAEMKIRFRWYVRSACERVIAVYEAWGKPEEVAEWKAKLDEVNVEIERLRNANMQSRDEQATDN